MSCPLLRADTARPDRPQTPTQTTTVTDIHADQSYGRATGADIALGSSLGLNITMTLRGKKATGLSPFLTSFISTGLNHYVSHCLSYSIRYLFNNKSSSSQCFVALSGPVCFSLGPEQRAPDKNVGLCLSFRLVGTGKIPVLSSGPWGWRVLDKHALFLRKDDCVPGWAC